MKVTIPPENKFCLTIDEAAAYFNVGVKRLSSLLNSPEGSELALMVGTKRLVKKRQLENYIDKVMSL